MVNFQFLILIFTLIDNTLARNMYNQVRCWDVRGDIEVVGHIVHVPGRDLNVCKEHCLWTPYCHVILVNHLTGDCFINHRSFVHYVGVPGGNKRYKTYIAVNCKSYYSKHFGGSTPPYGHKFYEGGAQVTYKPPTQPPAHPPTWNMGGRPSHDSARCWDIRDDQDFHGIFKQVPGQNVVVCQQECIRTPYCNVVVLSHLTKECYINYAKYAKYRYVEGGNKNYRTYISVDCGDYHKRRSEMSTVPPGHKFYEGGAHATQKPPTHPPTHPPTWNMGGRPSHDSVRCWDISENLEVSGNIQYVPGKNLDVCKERCLHTPYCHVIIVNKVSNDCFINSQSYVQYRRTDAQLSYRVYAAVDCRNYYSSSSEKSTVTTPSSKFDVATSESPEKSTVSLVYKFDEGGVNVTLEPPTEPPTELPTEHPTELPTEPPPIQTHDHDSDQLKSGKYGFGQQPDTSGDLELGSGDVSLEDEEKGKDSLDTDTDDECGGENNAGDDNDDILKDVVDILLKIDEKEVVKESKKHDKEVFPFPWLSMKLDVKN